MPTALRTSADDSGASSGSEDQAPQLLQSGKRVSGMNVRDDAPGSIRTCKEGRRSIVTSR